MLLTPPVQTCRATTNVKRCWQCPRQWGSSRRQRPYVRCAAQTTSSTHPAVQPVARVYVGRMPLVGMEGLAAALGVAGQLLEQHTYTVLDTGDGQVFICDFLPVSPTAPATAASLMTGGTVLGVTRIRRMQSSVKSSRTRFIGHANAQKPLEAVHHFNRDWDLQLALLKNDCRHHTEALVLHLTGIPAAVL